MFVLRGVIFGFLLLLSANASATVEQCKANFTQSGSFVSGRVFSSWEEFPQESAQALYKRIYSEMAKGGLKIVNADKELGIISAEGATAGGDGSAAVLEYSVVIEAVGKGSKSTLTIKSPPGKALSKEAVINSICG